MTDKFFGFFEIVYPFSEYNKITDESAFKDFLPTTNSYVSKTSFDYYDLTKMFNDASNLMKAEKERLEKLYEGTEFTITFSIGDFFGDTPNLGDDDEDVDEYVGDSTEDELPPDDEDEDEIVFTPEDEEDSDSLGSLILRNDLTGDIVCHIELFHSDFGDDDFAPSLHFSSTIH
jgi:hypothetical protein